MFIAALFTIARTWKQPKPYLFLSTDLTVCLFVLISQYPLISSSPLLNFSCPIVSD